MLVSYNEIPILVQDYHGYTLDKHMNIKELQLNINEHKQLFIGWFWQQVLKREQVSNPF